MLFNELKKLSCEAEIKENYIDFASLQAVIVGIAILPIEVEIEDWFSLLSKADNSPLSFSNEKLATQFAVTLTTCIQNIAKQIDSNEPLSLLLPENADLYQFAVTFFEVTYQYHKEWDDFVDHADEESAGMFQTTQLLICKLGKIMADDPEQAALFDQLPPESEIAVILPVLLSALGSVAKSQ